MVTIFMLDNCPEEGNNPRHSYGNTFFFNS